VPHVGERAGVASSFGSLEDAALFEAIRRFVRCAAHCRIYEA
jgi:hypothetical protein